MSSCNMNRKRFNSQFNANSIAEQCLLGAELSNELAAGLGHVPHRKTSYQVSHISELSTRHSDSEERKTQARDNSPSLSSISEVGLPQNIDEE